MTIATLTKQFEAPNKWRCMACAWIGPQDALRLECGNGSSPEWRACPSCGRGDVLTWACDEPGCDRPVVCGGSVCGRYRVLCTEHEPWLRQAGEAEHAA